MHIINNFTLQKVAGIRFSEIFKNAGSLFAITFITSIISVFISNYIVLTIVYILYLVVHIRISYQDVVQLWDMYRTRKTTVLTLDDEG